MVKPTPISDALRADGTWNEAWNEAAAFDPVWVEDYLKLAMETWKNSPLDPKTLEFIAIAVNASCTHMYAPGTRRHIGAALDLGATPAEINSVLQAVTTIGIHSVALASPILADEMAKRKIPLENIK